MPARKTLRNPRRLHWPPALLGWWCRSRGRHIWYCGSWIFYSRLWWCLPPVSGWRWFYPRPRFLWSIPPPPVPTSLPSIRICRASQCAAHGPRRWLWISVGDDVCLYTQFNITKEEGDELIQHKIISSPFYIIHKERCKKCGLGYAQCSCVRFIDENVSTEVTKAELLGMIWTNRNAFSMNGQLKYNN